MFPNKNRNLNIDCFRVSEKKFYQEFKKLDISQKNLLRPILFDPKHDQIKVLNRIRKIYNVDDLVKIQNALNQIEDIDRKVIPDLFPKTAQVFDDFYRLDCIPLEKQINLLEKFAFQNKSKLNIFFREIDELNQLILQNKFHECDKKINNLYKTFGYSHLLLRKIILIKELSEDKYNLSFIQDFLTRYNSNGRNLIISSLQQCYQADIDYLGLKKSIMNRSEKSIFCRHISEIPFLFSIQNIDEFNQRLSSHIQSSLIDSLFFLVSNESNFKFKKIDNIKNLISHKTNIVSLDQLAIYYKNKFEKYSEDLFYQHSSAWYEIKDLCNYRLLQDTFYEDPDAKFLEINPNKIKAINSWIKDLTLDDLVNSQILTKHNYKNLQLLEQCGSITRSSIFNFLMYKNQGNVKVTLTNLYKLMGITQDLFRTINPDYLRNAAANVTCIETQIIFYLLIAKKSRNEKDNHRLKKYLQKITIERFNGELVEFVNYLSKYSSAVAEYTYELCTEDFLATMSEIVPTTLKITETRADLHNWMGEHTGDRQYNDRARTLWIDHQINKIRNEIDDNRIYVDAVRFNEWISDEILRDFNSCLTSLSQNGLLEFYDSPQLTQLIERTYKEFCSNKIFGISSYLGRRIRHGTFKGHLYSNVILSLEEQFKNLLSDHTFSSQWKIWKKRYEKIIDNIIRDNLHIESPKNKYGLIKLDINSPTKTDVTQACAKNIISEYISKNGTSTLNTVILEYCWRIIVIDLRDINSFLKTKKNETLNKANLDQLKNPYNPKTKDLINNFTWLCCIKPLKVKFS
ncbi:hypothetical protein [Acinetobacter baumannii]|uniref:hypothetical protein n=1 Tax=Acinetobacter baumannii TaxID=470 RepID=UPI001FF46BF0|nr:hypothetical protein [Acinetobacter baumannii]